jgi:hypothetical protein
VELALRQEDDIWDNNPAVDPVAIRDTQDIEIEMGLQDVRYDADKYIDTQFIPQEYVKDFTFEVRGVGKEFPHRPAGPGARRNRPDHRRRRIRRPPGPQRLR